VFTVDVTWLSRATVLVVGYYAFLLVLPKLASLRARDHRAPPAVPPFMVLIIPAHNEEAVIAQTLAALERLVYQRYLIMVMNDGSRDATSSIANTFTAGGRVAVVDRGPDIAGRGKGAVLNHAFELVSDMVARGDPRLVGAPATDVVIGVMDADGQLEPHALERVAPFFGDPQVGGVQIGVRIANADDNVLTRMQDMEFVGFSAFVQRARDTLGSVGLGGNGQFTRLVALQSLGGAPWTDCLTEDLDLGLSLVELGWRIRFSDTAFVAQQGLLRLRPLLRQRTRWFQGHYQCWRHGPALARSRARLHTKADLLIYLFMISFIAVVFMATFASLLSLLGIATVKNEFLRSISSTPLRNALLELLSFGPLVSLIAKYQRHARQPLSTWQLPAYAACFSIYTYVFMISQVWAWTRIAMRRGAWAKTPRVAARQAV
jgi:cellulose synthase/poly-beta-1,6-N-acetylglucosamine synthase-like glycosyltransferase